MVCLIILVFSRCVVILIFYIFETLKKFSLQRLQAGRVAAGS